MIDRLRVWSVPRPGLAVRLGARALRRTPAITLLAVGILALGLAFPATFFSFLVGAIRPLPVPGGERVVRVDVLVPERDGAELPLTLADLHALGAPAALSGLGGFSTFGTTVVEPGSTGLRVAAAAVTPDVLGMLGVRPVVGRLPAVDDAGRVLLVGHRLWSEAYEASSDIVGRTVEVAGQPLTIIGVMPEGFGFPFHESAWTVVGPSASSDQPIELVGRLAEGASFEAAQAEIAAIWARTESLRPAGRRGGATRVAGFTSGRGEGGEAVAFVGLVLVALCLLLIACANVANLLMVRAADRVRALGIQAALGAGRAQIALQLLAEALLIAVLGGAVGLIIAWGLVDAIQAGLGAAHWGYHWMHMAVDFRVLAFAAVLVCGTAVVSGTLPIVRALRVDVLAVLEGSGEGSGPGGEGGGLRAFVSTQLALSCAALVAAGLAGTSLRAGVGLHDEELAERVVMTTVDAVPESIGPFASSERILATLGGSSATEAATVAVAAPFREPATTFEVEGATYERPDDRPTTSWNGVGPDYFDAFRLEVRAGRAFVPEGAEAEPVALVNESFARRFGTAGAVGSRIRLAGGDEPWRTVVGVVSDATVGGGERARHDRVYLPWSQTEPTTYTVIARGRVNATGLASDVREAITSADPRLPIVSQATVSETIAFLTRIPRVLGGFAIGGGLAGGFVAAVGLYGLLAFRVRQRRKELGVRLALGADGAALAIATLRHAGAQLVPGIVAGLALAWIVAPIFGVFLLTTEPRRPLTFVSVGLGFLAIGLAAAAIPALRAARTEPAGVLRGE